MYSIYNYIATILRYSKNIFCIINTVFSLIDQQFKETNTFLAFILLKTMLN